MHPLWPTHVHICPVCVFFFFFSAFHTIHTVMVYLGLSLVPPNPKEAREIWFANNWGHCYCWVVEVAAHGAVWMALPVRSILPWTITCPAAIGCCVSVNEAGGTLHQPHQWGECHCSLDSAMGVSGLQVCRPGINTMFSQLWSNHQNCR